MTGPAGQARRTLAGAGRRAQEGWQLFFFAPQSTATVALVRIALGIVVFGWTLSQVGGLGDFYGSSGIAPNPPGLPGGSWTLLGPAHSGLALAVAFCLLLAASIALIVGLGSRVAAVAVFVLVMSFQRRDFYILNSGDQLVLVLSLYVMLMPSGAALSVDRWRRRAREAFWRFPARAPWALRLMQIQVSVVYITSVWAKVRGTTWNDGTALSYALRLGDLQRLHLPHWLNDSLALSTVFGYGTLLVELSLGVLVWNRKLRPWVLAAGICLHVGIAITIRVGFFSQAVLVMYLAFLRPATAERLILAGRQRLARLRPIRRRYREPMRDGGQYVANASPMTQDVGTGPQ